MKLTSTIKDFIQNYGYLCLLVLSLIIFFLDLYYLHGLPGLKLFETQTLSEVSALRNDIHMESPSWIIYLSGFNIRCFFPFLILLMYVQKRYILFVTCLLLGSFYAFGLLQKSYAVFLILPTLIYAVSTRKYLLSTLLTIVIAGIISIIIIGSSDKINDDLTSQTPDIELNQNKDKRPFIVRITLGMSIRIFVTPGEMVAKWFDNIPSNKPFLYGDGYPLLPRLKGTEYRDYNKELYPIIRPQYAERGLTGTVNTATFVREYSNFGWLGLVLSSFIVALFFTLQTNIFKGYFIANLALNMIFILMLSSTNLWTLLVSGGWFMIIILFAIFKDSFKTNLQNSNNEE